MSLPVPASMDGQIIEEAISPNFQPDLTKVEADWELSNNGQGQGPTEEQGLTEEQKKIVAERLRGLGYVG